MINLKLQRRHGLIKVHSVRIVQQQNLKVRLSALGGLATLTTTMYLFDHNHKKSNKRRPRLDSRNDVPLKLIQPGVNLSIIQRLRSFPTDFNNNGQDPAVGQPQGYSKQFEESFCHSHLR